MRLVWAGACACAVWLGPAAGAGAGFVTRAEVPAGTAAQTFESLTPGATFDVLFLSPGAFEGTGGLEAIDATPLGGTGVALAARADGGTVFLTLRFGVSLLGLDVGGGPARVRFADAAGIVLGETTTAGAGVTFVGYALDEPGRAVRQVAVFDATPNDGVRPFIDNVVAVPEPAGLALLAIGGVAMAAHASLIRGIRRRGMRVPDPLAKAMGPGGMRPSVS